MLTVPEKWERVFAADHLPTLEAQLLAWLPSARWYGAKARSAQSVRLVESIALPRDAGGVYLVFVELAYADGGRETYVVPLAAAFREEAEGLERDSREAVVSTITIKSTDGARQGLLYDALWNPTHATTLVQAVREGGRFPGRHGELVASPTKMFSETAIDPSRDRPSVMKGEQSNTSVKFGSRAMLKLYRRMEAGVNPDLEIGRLLTEQRFPHSPPVLGALEYVGSAGEPATVAIVHGFTANHGNAWQYTLDELARDLRGRPGSRAASSPPSEVDRSSANAYAVSAATLGRRTAELHLALAGAGHDPAFSPEACTPEYWRAVSDRIGRSIQRAMRLLNGRLVDLGGEDRDRARHVLSTEQELLSRVAALATRNPTAVRIRCHGDYHLGQVLYTGRDFVIIDFEGEPARPLAERRAKQVPLVDVAGMIRSFHYAAYVALDQQGEGRSQETSPAREEAVISWYRAARAAFVEGYRELAATASFWPPVAEERELLLDLHLIDKALYELSYELNNRPAWVGVPLRGILQLVEPEEAPLFQ